jgi:catechol 2,3-dioxygenase-like lactoylglutathione lyase family enzyme
MIGNSTQKGLRRDQIWRIRSIAFAQARESMMAIVRLDHVQVAAPRGGEAVARAFYGGLLQMPEIAKPPALASRGGVWFRAGEQQLHVGIEEPFAPARKAHPAFAVDNLDSLAERLQGAGITVTWDEAVPAQRRFFTGDPFGNRLEFVQAS